jgi:hypothetical protein
MTEDEAAIEFNSLQIICPSKVDGKGVLSDANTAGTSNLDWRCFEYYQIDGNGNLICKNLRIIKIKIKI